MGDRIDLTNNDGPLVNIAAWFSIAVAGIATVGKLYTKLTMAKSLDWTDAAIGASLLTSVGMVVATSQQVDSGLGRDEDTLSESQINKFYLTSYVALLFYVLSTFISKFAPLHFFLCLTRKRRDLFMISGSIVFVAVWIVVAILVLSFQCSLPNTWLLERQQGTCIQEVPFWIVHGVVDLITQLMVSLPPLYLLHDLNTSGKRKRFVMLSFTPNLLTIPFIIFRMIYLGELYTSTNPTRDSWKLFLISVVHANVSIFVASIPFAKPILDSLSVGVITNDVRHGLAWDQMNYLVYARGSRSDSARRNSANPSKLFTSRKSESGGSSGPSDNESQPGMAQSKEMKHGSQIRRTVETTIESVQRPL